VLVAVRGVVRFAHPTTHQFGLGFVLRTNLGPWV
jgi:hypothetical protein